MKDQELSLENAKNSYEAEIKMAKVRYAPIEQLAAGIITYEEVGPEYPIEEIVLHEIIPYQWEGNKFFGMIDTADYHFGLICSNIPADVFEKAGVSYGDLLNVKIRKHFKWI